MFELEVIEKHSHTLITSKDESEIIKYMNEYNLYEYTIKRTEKRITLTYRYDDDYWI